MSDNKVYDILISKIDDLHDDVKDMRKEFNGRVRKLELWRSYLLGAGAVSAIVWKMLF